MVPATLERGDAAVVFRFFFPSVEVKFLRLLRKHRELFLPPPLQTLGGRLFVALSLHLGFCT